MTITRSVYLFLYISLMPHQSIAQVGDASWFNTPITTQSECENLLGDYTWVCSEFQGLEWRQTYGSTFWKTGQILFGEMDLDNNEIDDIIIRIEHVGYCGSSGCSYIFIFDSQTRYPHPPLYSITAQNNPIIHNNENGAEIRFCSNCPSFLASEIRSNSDALNRLPWGL